MCHPGSSAWCALWLPGVRLPMPHVVMYMGLSHWEEDRMLDSRGSATLAVSVPVEADTMAALEGVAKGCRRIGRQRGPPVHLPRGLYPTRRRFFKHLERLGVHEHGHFEQVGHFPHPVAAMLSSSKADSSMGGTAHAAGRDSSHRSTSARRQPTARDPSPPNRIGGGKSPERMRLQSDVRLSPA